jgi:hypothetical protein
MSSLDVGGYGDRKLIAIGNVLVSGKTDQLRAQLGNGIARRGLQGGQARIPTRRHHSRDSLESRQL